MWHKQLTRPMGVGEGKESSVRLPCTLEKSAMNLGKVQTFSFWEAPHWRKQVRAMVKLAFWRERSGGSSQMVWV